MDAGALYDVFNASFHSDPNVRMQAELQLKKVESQEGFFPIVVQLISSANGDNAQVVRLAAAIYLKNRVFSSWRPPVATDVPTNKISPYTPIADSDRQALKQAILPLIAGLSGSQETHAIKLQMAATLSKLVDYDYPEKWQNIVPEVENALSGNEGQVEAGLRACVDIMRSFRFAKSDSDPAVLENTARHFFPRLLQIAQQVAASEPSDGYQIAQQGTLLRLVLKAYKHCIASSLTPALSDSASLVPWGTFFLSLVQKRLPVEQMPSGDDDRQKHPWSKAKKWAHWCLNVLFERYGNPPQLQKGMQEKYGAFAQVFITQFAPEIIKSYLNEVERSVQGEWVPRKAQHYVLHFFEECIRSKATWDLLKPHVESLVQHFIFPLVCLSEEEAAEIDDDPEEFARTHIAELVDDSWNNPTMTSLAFIATLVEVRKKSQLVPLLNFIQTVVSKYPESTTVVQKDGALRLLGAIAEVATTSKKIAPMMESFFTTHILPEFKSPHALLRYRVCDTIEKFERNDMEWNNKDNLRRMFAAMLEAITDSNLPVRLAAANALPELVRYTEVRDQMVPNIGRVMQELLKLTEEIDLDSLTSTMRTIVGEFADEVVPFALELIQKLSESLRRLIPELLEARQRVEESSLDDEKALVCMNLFKTIDQVLAGLQDQPDLLGAVTPIVLPLIEMIVNHGLTELFDEAYELLDSLTFFYKQMTPEMWPIFDATYRILKGEHGTYFTDVYGFIDNAISYGSTALSTDHERKNMLIDLFTYVMDSRMLGAEDRVVGCKLGEAMLLHLRGYVDEAIPPIVERSMNFVLTTKEDPDFVVTTGLYYHSLELAFTALFYNPALTLAILDRHNWTQQFFAAWFKHLNTLNRVHDIKLSVCAVCAVFEYLSQNPSAPLASAASQLLAGSLEMFKHLPNALTKKAELEKEYAKEGGASDDGDEEEELVDDDFDDAGDEGDVRDTSYDLLDRLAQKYADDDDAANSDLASEWSEEVLWASPLDAIDVYNRFATLITGLETSSPTLFQSATSSLTNEQKHRLEEIVRNAMQGGEQVYRPAAGQTGAQQGQQAANGA